MLELQESDAHVVVITFSMGVVKIPGYSCWLRNQKGYQSVKKCLHHFLAILTCNSQQL